MESSSRVRMTRQRRVILEVLAADKTHPSVEEVYAKVRRSIPGVSLGTVYRNLEKLADDGMIRRMDTAGSKMRFDGNPRDHHHIRCRSCGRMEDIDDFTGSFSPKPPDEISGYKVVGVRVYLIGICPRCRRSGGENSASGGLLDN